MQTLHTPRQNWQQELAEAVTDSEELCRILHIPADQLAHAPWVDRRFPIRVPRSYLARMQPGDPNDPLFLQVFASIQEADKVAGFNFDPVGDQQASALPGLLQKYQGRVLLVVTGACAIHCRYCFRRHYPYGEGMLKPEQWQSILDFLAERPDIEEVILSGGDPLMLSSNKLGKLLADLSKLPGIRRLRLHSRLPVVLPSRIDRALLAALDRFAGDKVLVIHANHARELNDETAAALGLLRAGKITLLNQSVLLKGVNDRAETLLELSKRLFSLGVLPYYLHQLDTVAGAAHFQVDDRQARSLMAELAAQLSGYLVPKLVREIAGDTGKRQLSY